MYVLQERIEVRAGRVCPWTRAVGPRAATRLASRWAAPTAAAVPPATAGTRRTPSVCRYHAPLLPYSPADRERSTGSLALWQIIFTTGRHISFCFVYCSIYVTQNNIVPPIFLSNRLTVRNGRGEYVVPRHNRRAGRWCIYLLLGFHTQRVKQTFAVRLSPGCIMNRGSETWNFHKWWISVIF